MRRDESKDPQQKRLVEGAVEIILDSHHCRRTCTMNKNGANTSGNQEEEEPPLKSPLHHQGGFLPLHVCWPLGRTHPKMGVKIPHRTVGRFHKNVKYKPKQRKKKS
ncbi:hypothetical protein V6N11_054651 [Hibiscus sabdariffa]|uniref:Uncharacterized protein n=1 Tax=Hibiscus sabdariffa TaxID=183260 RepID=A0ABR2S4I4_9ROSI